MNRAQDRPSVLLVEDEKSLSDPVKRGLEEEGYVVDVASDGPKGLMKALADEYDVLIVDWRLPGLDGRTLVERLRAAGRSRPVLMLTALRGVEHRIAGLDAGADDYLAKPFSFEELLARLRALRRRASEGAGPTTVHNDYLELGSLVLDVARRSARIGSVELGLRTKEYLLLELLARRVGQVVTRTVIAERVWGSPFEVTDNAIDVTVSNLRSRLSDAAEDGGGIAVATVRGIGYCLEESLPPR